MIATVASPALSHRESVQITWTQCGWPAFMLTSETVQLFPRTICLASQLHDMSLPAALKHLLKQRSPNAFPSPGLAKLSGILGTTLAEAQIRRAERGWICVTVGQSASNSACMRFIEPSSSGPVQII